MNRLHMLFNPSDYRGRRKCVIGYNDTDTTGTINWQGLGSNTRRRLSQVNDGSNECQVLDKNHRSSRTTLVKGPGPSNGQILVMEWNRDNHRAHKLVGKAVPILHPKPTPAFMHANRSIGVDAVRSVQEIVELGLADGWGGHNWTEIATTAGSKKNVVDSVNSRVRREISVVVERASQNHIESSFFTMSTEIK